MAKGQKSSATSGTRKKNARKATQSAPPPSAVPKQSKPKGLKLSKREAREQRKKVYIPPTKPAPPVLDPLDTTGLVHSLPPELVVVLRALGKKDAITRGKAIEELAKWVDDAIKEQDHHPDRYEEPGEKTDVVVKMLPVWLHRVPVLFTHPARRLRHLAASLHASFLRLNPARESLLAWLSEVASQNELETLLGTWSMLAHDVDRGVAVVAMRSWMNFVSAAPTQTADIRDIDHTNPQVQCPQSQPKLILNPSLLISLFKFAQHAILDPQGLHTALNPVAVILPSSQQGHKAAPQTQGITLGKKGNPASQKKSGRYVPPSPNSLPAAASRLGPDQVVDDSAGEENDLDRGGRIRVGALGVVRWTLEIWPAATFVSTNDLSILTSFLSSLAFWSTLHPAITSSHSNPANHRYCPFSTASFGQGQPQVRQAAWALLGSLVVVLKGRIPEPLIRILSTAVLRSAWVETDVGAWTALGSPLMVFLRDCARAWAVDAENALSGYKDLDVNVKVGDNDVFGSDVDSESGSESERESDSEADALDALTELPPNGRLPSEAYREFLRFLELGCSGSPVEGYPLVSLVLAGIPSSILPTDLPATLENVRERDGEPPNIHPISQLFTSFWAPVDAGLLDGQVAALSWLKALGECLVLITRRGVGVRTESITSSANEGAKSLVASQVSRLWGELVTKRLRVLEIEAARVIACAAERVGKIGDDIFDTFFDTLSSHMLDSFYTSDDTIGLAPTLLHVFSATFERDTHGGQKTRDATEIYVHKVIEALDNALKSSDQIPNTTIVKNLLAALLKLMDVFGPSLFDDEYFASRTDATFLAHPVALLQTSKPAVLAYLALRSKSSNQLRGELQTQAFWTEFLGAVASLPTKMALSLLSPLVGASLPTHLRATNVRMDELVEYLVTDAVATGGQGDEEHAVARVLSAPVPFISSGCLATIAFALLNSAAAFVDTRVRVAGVPFDRLAEVPDLARAGPPVGLIRILVGSGYELTEDIGVELYTSIFLLGYVIPYQAEVFGNKWVEDAKALWSSWISRKGDKHEEMRDIVGGLVKEKLKGIVVEDKAETRPEYIIRCVTPSPPGIQINPLVDILPSCEEFDAMLESPFLPSSSASPGLALLDPTLPPSSSVTPTFLNSACKKYVRATSALLVYFTTSRMISRSNLWALRHILILSFYANEYLRMENAQDNLVAFGGTRDQLKDIVEKAKSLTTYLLGRGEDGLHAKVVSALMSKDSTTAGEDGNLASFVVAVARRAQAKDFVRDATVLGIVLQHLFGDATMDDTELWLALARRWEKTAPQTSITILASITSYAPEPSKLDRYRNELAASLIGIRPGAASTAGLITLRLLAATAPDPNSDVVFLPQQRAVNVMKACQAWVAADEDEGVSEDVESVMTLVFFHLAPILQNVPGSHWDFIWDMIENNFENCSLEDSNTLTVLGRTLRLFIAIDDLTLTNKPLRAEWAERKSTMLRLVRGVVAVDTLSMPYTEPRTLCRELALTIIQDMPSTVMDEKTLPSMCHLLGDQSQEVQRMGYRFLHNAARKRTEHYVIEAGVDTEDLVQPVLPPELIAILQRSLSSGEELDLDEQSVPRNKEVSGHLLAWMIAFDLFTDASMKVRSSYFNHMRSLDIISQHFIPNIFDALGLFTGGREVFKLDVWAVDEFYLENFEPESSLSLKLLAAHLYHRALLTVPALVRSWISDRTDKQLLTRIVDYTSSYFSPGIIKAELAQVRQPVTSSELSSTENLAVKASPASGEVTVSYTVDDQALELSIRMPNDWPLHRLEVRDTKMVGVSEDKWRAWILGVQQVVWQQNGRIVDALTLFSKNVMLHFSGQVECAICYSIISVMDSSLPQKPCKTCKNRFHASCLYKWFKSSHSSSCPLCRSDIL